MVAVVGWLFGMAQVPVVSLLLLCVIVVCSATLLSRCDVRLARAEFDAHAWQAQAESSENTRSVETVRANDAERRLAANQVSLHEMAQLLLRYRQRAIEAEAQLPRLQALATDRLRLRGLLRSVETWLMVCAGKKRGNVELLGDIQRALEEPATPPDFQGRFMEFATAAICHAYSVRPHDVLEAGTVGTDVRTLTPGNGQRVEPHPCGCRVENGRNVRCGPHMIEGPLDAAAVEAGDDLEEHLS